MTKCMLVSAITKIHSNMSFTPLEFINNTIVKFTRDKNVEIQQRCYEYKRLSQMSTAIVNNQFTTTVDDIDIDVDLSFLDAFVKNRINNGAKVYDRKKFEQERNIFERDQGGKLNIGPYTAPETMSLNPSEQGQQLTRLYDPTHGTTKQKISGELIVTGKKIWSAQGISEVKEPIPPNHNPVTNQISSVSSSSFNNSNSSNNMVVTNNNSNNGPKDPRYTSVAGQKLTDTKGKPQQNQNVLFPMAAKKVEAPVYDEKKEKLKLALFPTAKPSTGNPNTGVNKPQGLGIKTNTNNKPSNSNQNTNVDFLGLNTVVTPQPNTNTISSTNKPNNFDLWDDIFTSSSTPSNTNTQEISSVSQGNLLTNEPSQPKSGGGMFDMFKNTKPTPTNLSQNKALQKQDISPMNIDTDTFGEYWTECPNDEKSIEIQAKGVNTPEKYFEIISSKANFFPVQIINNEAIASAKLVDNIVLLHTTINGNNTLSILVKSSDSSLHDRVAEFITSIFR